MCGRYKVFASAGEIQTRLFRDSMAGLQLDAGVFEGATPRYNVAPTQSVPVIGRNGGRHSMVPMRWGLVPHWAKDASIGHKLINARSETAFEKPSFGEAIRKRRCLIPADGFYEWERVRGRKRPLLFERGDQAPFAFAGLWEVWKDGGGTAPLYTCTILTTTPNELVAPFHVRMPVVVEPEAIPVWLDGDSRRPELEALLRPADPEGWQVRYVSDAVNDPNNDSPECVRPAI